VRGAARRKGEVFIVQQGKADWGGWTARRPEIERERSDKNRECESADGPHLRD